MLRVFSALTFTDKIEARILKLGVRTDNEWKTGSSLLFFSFIFLSLHGKFVQSLPRLIRVFAWRTYDFGFVSLQLITLNVY